MSALATLNLGYLGPNLQTHNNSSQQKPLLLLQGTQSLPTLAASKNHLPRFSYANFSLKTSTNVKTAVAAVESSGHLEKVSSLIILNFFLLSLSLSSFYYAFPAIFLIDDLGFFFCVCKFICKQQETEEKKTYHFVVANAKFMLDEEEHFQEQLSERVRLFEERNQEQDFWLVIEPKFLDKFPNITKRLKRPAVALVSTNGPWIT